MNTFRRTARPAAHLAVVAIALVACGAPSSQDTAAEPSDAATASSDEEAAPSVSLGAVVDPAWGQVPVAQEFGLFDAAGVEVEVVNFSSGADAMEALIGGAVDVVTAADVPTSAGIVAADDIRILAQGAFHDNMRIVADGALGIAEMSDLEGMKIGTAFGTSAHFMVSSFLDQAGVDAELVQVSPPEIETVLDRGDIDAAAIFEPYATQVTESLGDHAVILTGEPPYVSLVFYNTLETTLEDNTDGIARLLAALECGSELLAAGDGDAEAAVGGATGLEGATLTSVLDGYTFGLSLDDAIAASLEDLAQWAMDEGNLDADAGLPDYAGHLDATALDASTAIEGFTCEAAA